MKQERGNAEGYYRKAAEAFGQVLAALKGTQYGDECLFLLGMSNYRMGDFVSRIYRYYCNIDLSRQQTLYH